MDALIDLVNCVYGLPAVHIIRFIGDFKYKEECIACSLHIDIRRVRALCRQMEKPGILRSSRGSWSFDKREAAISLREILDDILKKIPEDNDTANMKFKCRICQETRRLEDCLQIFMTGDTITCCNEEMTEDKQDGNYKTVIQEIRDSLGTLINPQE